MRNKMEATSAEMNMVTPTNMAEDKKSNNETERVFGVKGWCFGSNERSHEAVCVGMGDVPAGYIYLFCTHCGKCQRPRNSDSYDVFVLCDKVKEAQINEADMTTSDKANAKMAVQEELLKIPDGEVVIPGKCSCKEPSPVQGGSAETEIVSVCEACGLRCD